MTAVGMSALGHKPVLGSRADELRFAADNTGVDRKISTAFSPPNAKLFDMVYVRFLSRPTFGT